MPAALYPPQEFSVRMFHSGFGRTTWVKAMPLGSFIGQILSGLATEHVCAPPDSLTRWTAVPSALARRADAYVCPECGQGHVRVARAQSFGATSTGSVPSIAPRRTRAYA